MVDRKVVTYNRVRVWSGLRLERGHIFQVNRKAHCRYVDEFLYRLYSSLARHAAKDTRAPFNALMRHRECLI